MSEKILHDPSLLKKGMVFKYPSDKVEEYIQDHFEFIEWVSVDGVERSMRIIPRKAERQSNHWSSYIDQIVSVGWSKDSLVESGFVIVYPINKMKYKRISRRRA